MSEGQIAELIRDREIKAGEVTGDATLLVGAGLAIEPVDEIDDLAEPLAGRTSAQQPDFCQEQN